MNARQRPVARPSTISGSCADASSIMATTSSAIELGTAKESV